MPHSPTAVGDWISRYLQQQKAALDSIPQEAVARIVERFRVALAEDRQIFVFGNGGSGTDGKGGGGGGPTVGVALRELNETQKAQLSQAAA